MDAQLETLVELDRRLVEAARRIKILSYLAWTPQVRHEFLAGVRTGRPALPTVILPKLDFAPQVEALHEIDRACDRQHPVGFYVSQTARSYVTAASMLESVGTPRFTERSVELYGRPGDPLASGVTNIDAADHFIRVTDEFAGSLFIPTDELVLTPEDVARQIGAFVAPVFHDRPIEVVIDPELGSKAAAGASRVRIQGEAPFSAVEVGQLVQHEVLVHSATMRNGREQPYLKSMGLGAPRTTCTQEGLATLAELITSTIDLGRLRRIALRVKAIQMALDGADFLEVFRWFLESRQDEGASYLSAMRVFRGGDVRGRVAFTKDSVYVQGLIFTHTFLRKAIQSGKVEYPHYLFAGRLTLGDVVHLDPFFKSGFIAPPKYEPAWAANRQCLAAYLCYSVFVNRINLSDVELIHFLDDGA